jgi:hypothetical protein
MNFADFDNSRKKMKIRAIIQILSLTLVASSAKARELCYASPEECPEPPHQICSLNPWTPDSFHCKVSASTPKFRVITGIGSATGANDCDVADPYGEALDRAQEKAQGQCKGRVVYTKTIHQKRDPDYTNVWACGVGVRSTVTAEFQCFE